MKTRRDKIFKSGLVRNGAWGIIANLLQVICVSAFFVILARKYPATVFAQFLIASTVYQMVAAFSSMGLGQWFIRQFEHENDKPAFIAKFLKVQILLGILFYIISILGTYLLYSQQEIRVLSAILGVNIIFDNLIYGIRNLNIAEQKQKSTFLILTIDSFLKLMIGCLLFISSLSIIYLVVLLIIARFLTLNFFLKIGSASVTLKLLRRATITMQDLRTLIFRNWRFILIGSISVIFWRVSNIIIAKFLSLQDIANYEIAFRIFSIQLMIPIIGASTVYPQFIKYWNAGDRQALKAFYQKMFLLYNVYAFLSYIFIYSFADVIILYAFGEEYRDAASCLRQMFLAAIIFPTVLLQANLIVSMRMEKSDMWFNIIALAVNVVASVIGLMFIRSVGVVNYSICFAFVVFHLLQSILLAREKVVSIAGTLCFYLVVPATVVMYHFLISRYDNSVVFTIVSAVIIAVTCIIFGIMRRNSARNLIAPVSPAFSSV